jgi:hypothetical protein
MRNFRGWLDNWYSCLGRVRLSPLWSQETRFSEFFGKLGVASSRNLSSSESVGCAALSSPLFHFGFC